MADEPLPEEVELTEPVVSESEPEKAVFEQVDDLPEKPPSDVKIRLADGTEFRERFVRIPIPTDTVRTEPDNEVAPLGFNFAISLALLDEQGSVATDATGAFRIAPVTEASFTGERLGGMSDAEIEAALLHAREIAAAKAKAFFEGMDRGAMFFAGRLG